MAEKLNKLTFLLKCVAISAFLCVIIKVIWAKERTDVNGPIVNIDGLGEVVGSIAYGKFTNKPIYQFLGLRYAISPKETGRFKPPIAERPWHGIRNVQNYSRPCPQLGVLSKMTEKERAEQDLEDCLHLSIYSGDLYRSVPTAVMVYIHGGGFSEGGAAWYPPNYLMESDIVLVVPQFRLDALGFLSLNTQNMPGNAGIMDAILALKWVQQHIRHFGGDPRRVTLFGQSSGAAMVSAMAISPIVPETMFDQIIVQSGSAMSYWCYSFAPIENARDIAQRAGLPTNLTLAELHTALVQLDLLTLLKARSTHYNDGFLNGITTVGGAMTLKGPTNFLPAIAFQIKRGGQYRKNLKVMTGVTKHDGSFVVAAIYDILASMNKLNDRDFITYDLIDLLRSIVATQDDGGGLAAFADSIYWTQDEIISANFTRIAPGLIDYIGTIALKAPIFRLVNAYARYNPNNTYLYTFDYIGEHTRFGYGQEISHYPFDGGVHHSNDYLYLFPYPEKMSNLNADDIIMAKKMVHLWSSFALNGKPDLLDAERDLEWKPVTKYSGPYLHIDKEWNLGENFMSEYTVSIKKN